MNGPLSDDRQSRPTSGTAAATLVASQLAGAGLGLLSTVLAARVLGPTEYGRAAVIMALPSVVFTLLSFKTVTVIVRYTARYLERGEVAEFKAVVKLGYVIDLAVGLLAFLILCAIAFVWNPVPGVPPWLMPCFAASFPAASFAGTSLAVFSSFRRFQSIALIQLGEAAITAVLVVGVLGFRPSVSSFVGTMALGQAAGGFVWLLGATRLLRREALGGWARARIRSARLARRELVQSLGWNYLSVSLNGVLFHVPILLLNSFRGSREAAFFRLASTLSVVGLYPDSALSRIAQQELAEHAARSDEQGARRVMLNWLRREGALGASLVAIGAAPVAWAAPILLGDGYRQAVPGMLLMLEGAAIGTCFFFVIPYFYSVGRVGFAAKSFVAYASIMGGALAYATNRHGFTGAALVAAVGHPTYRLAMFLAIRWGVRRDVEQPPGGTAHP